MDIIGNDITVFILICLMASAFIAGFIDSVAGGGGLILVPSFILAGLPPQLALGQEKVVSTLGTTAAIYNFVRNKSVVWKAVGIGIPFGLIGAYLGAESILYFNPNTIGKIILFMLPIGIFFSFFPKKDIQGTNAVTDSRAVMYVGVPLCVFTIGFYDGFFGPGTGSFFILAFHYLLKFDLVSSSATSKLFNFSSNVGALIVFTISGNVLLALGIPLVIMNILGNYLGSSSAIKYGPKLISRTITISLTLLMFSLGYKFILT